MVLYYAILALVLKFLGLGIIVKVFLTPEFNYSQFLLALVILVLSDTHGILAEIIYTREKTK